MSSFQETLSTYRKPDRFRRAERICAVKKDHAAHHYGKRKEEKDSGEEYKRAKLFHRHHQSLDALLVTLSPVRMPHPQAGSQALRERSHYPRVGSNYLKRHIRCRMGVYKDVLDNQIKN